MTERDPGLGSARRDRRRRELRRALVVGGLATALAWLVGAAVLTRSAPPAEAEPEVAATDWVASQPEETSSHPSLDESVTAADDGQALQEPLAQPVALEPLVEWPPADAAFEIEALPPEERTPMPKAVRGIYLNAWGGGSSRRTAALLALADTTEINTFVIDVKDATGYVSYRSRVPLAQALGSDDDVRIRDPRGLLERLREHGIYAIARIVVFKDPVLAARRPDLAIETDTGGTWIDHHGHVWVDMYNREVWDYNIALAREAVALGFDEVQWDYVRFPDVPDSYRATAVYPAQEGRTRQEAIREFLQYAQSELADLGVPVTADVFGITVSAENDVGIGQQWEAMSDVADVLLPMVYPSHYPPGSYGIEDPNASPYRTVRTAMENAVERSSAIEGAARIRPWLQDFTLGEPVYEAPQVRAQIQAVYDAGLSEWILWSPGNRYSEDALAAPGGIGPYYPDWMPPPTYKVPTPRVRVVPLRKQEKPPLPSPPAG